MNVNPNWKETRAAEPAWSKRTHAGCDINTNEEPSDPRGYRHVVCSGAGSLSAAGYFGPHADEIADGIAEMLSETIGKIEELQAKYAAEST